MNGAPEAGQSHNPDAATAPGGQLGQQQLQGAQIPPDAGAAASPPHGQPSGLTVPVLLDRVAQLEHYKTCLEHENRQMHQQLQVLSGFLHVVSTSVRTTENLLFAAAVNPTDPHIIGNQLDASQLTSVPSNSTATPAGSLAAAPAAAGTQQAAGQQGQAAAAATGPAAGAGAHGAAAAAAAAVAAAAAPETLHGSSGGFPRNASNAGTWASSTQVQPATAGSGAAAALAADAAGGANGTPDSDLAATAAAAAAAAAAAGFIEQVAGSSGGARASPEDGSNGVGRGSPAVSLPTAAGLERSSKRAKTSHRAAAPPPAATAYLQQQQQLLDAAVQAQQATAAEQPPAQQQSAMQQQQQQQTRLTRQQSPYPAQALQHQAQQHQQLVPQQQALPQQVQLVPHQQQPQPAANTAPPAALASASAAAAAAASRASVPEAPLVLKATRIKGPSVLHGDEVVIYRLEVIRHGVLDKYMFLPNDTMPLYGVKSWQHRDAIPQELLKMVENCLTTKSVSSEQFADEVKAMKAAMLTQCPHLARWGLGSNKVRLVTESGLRDLVQRLHRTSQRHGSVMSPRTLDVDISWVSCPDTPQVPVEEWTAPVYSRRLPPAAAAAAAAAVAAAAAAEDGYGGGEAVAASPYMMPAGLPVNGLLSDDSSGMATSAAMAAGMHLSAEVFQQHLLQVQQQQQQQPVGIGVMTPVLAQMQLSGQQQQQQHVMQQQVLQQQALQHQGQLQQGVTPEFYSHHQNQQQQLHLQQLQLYMASQQPTLLNQAGIMQQEQQMQQVSAHNGPLAAASDPSQGLVSVSSGDQAGLSNAATHTALAHNHSGVVLNLHTQGSRSDFGSLAAAGSVAADTTMPQPHQQQAQQHLVPAAHSAALAALPAQLASKLLQHHQLHNQQQQHALPAHTVGSNTAAQQLAAQQHQQAAVTAALAQQQQQTLTPPGALGSHGSTDSVVADAVAGLQALRSQGSLPCPIGQQQQQQPLQQPLQPLQQHLNLRDVVGRDLDPVRDQHAAGIAAAGAGMPTAPGGTLGTQGAAQAGPAAVITVQQ